MGPEGGEGASSRGISVGYRQIWSQLVEVKRIQSIVTKLVLTFWKVKHCKGRRGGEGVRRSAAQKQHFFSRNSCTFASWPTKTPNTFNPCWVGGRFGSPLDNTASGFTALAALVRAPSRLASLLLCSRHGFCHGAALRSRLGFEALHRQ